MILASVVVHNRPMIDRRRLASALWIAWAVIVWNVVFDRVLVVAGRQYVWAAAISAREQGPYVRIADWMRPAVLRAFWFATGAAAVILVGGFLALRAAGRPSRASRELSPTGVPCPQPPIR